MSIIVDIKSKDKWDEFLRYKRETGNLDRDEERLICEFIDDKKFLKYYELIEKNEFPANLPRRKIVNKEGSKKKRIVYTFEQEENIVFKFIAHNLYVYDYVFSDNCYAFRRNYGVKDAVNKLKSNKIYGQLYCYKADISNYFNSINVDKLLEMLFFIKEKDIQLYKLFEKVLLEKNVCAGKNIICEEHGAMAGTPCSTFFANVYLKDVDLYFKENEIKYFRYSDDVLIFAKTREELQQYIELFNGMIADKGLVINEDKVYISNPHEEFEFLGFSYNEGNIDLSKNTLKKMKAKIKRKAEALRRWQRAKGISEDKAAIGFIRAMNNKFYGRKRISNLENNENHIMSNSITDDINNDGIDNDKWDRNELTWSRWFFPNITVDTSLKEIDRYMQQYIRYIITGRHYKGNYRISYEQIKKWEYRSLVHEFYKKTSIHKL